MEYDAIIIGAGQGGIPLATALRDAGWKTALIEKEHLGGTCVNCGCTPTKTMIASGRIAHLTGRAADYGVHTTKPEINLLEVRARKRNIVETFRIGLEKRIEGVDLYVGEARFAGPKEIEVGDHHLIGKKIFINTGAHPSLPPIPGIEGVKTLDSTSIMELGEIPEHLIVIGGGYIGLEFGQLFRRFGSKVTILTHGSQILSREDADIAEAVQEVLKGDGIEIVCNAKIERVEPQVTVVLDNRNIVGSHLLVATGRTPNSLNFDVAGVETDAKGFVKVNEFLETTAPDIYAIGDIKGGPAFTHISYDDYRILKANLLDNSSRSTKNRLVPYTLYIDPQLGRVGLNEKEAQKLGLDYSVATTPMTSVARALETDETRGVMKALIDNRTDRILGAAVLGMEGGELMSMIEIAMMGDLPFTALRDATFSHPSFAESLNTLFSNVKPSTIKH